MPRPVVKTVAIIAASPALSSILASVLAEAPGLRVRRFETQHALTTYMSIAPVDLVVADFDSTEARADRLAGSLRHDKSLLERPPQIVALARRLGPGAREAAIAAGIDEVIVKPMSPRYLLERVVARLRVAPAHITTPSGYAGPERRRRLPVPDYRSFGDNIIPLFERRHESRPA